MREQLEQRLLKLRAERDTGQQRLAQLDRAANDLRATLMRISGAIQVLEEELAEVDNDAET